MHFVYRPRPPRHALVTQMRRAVLLNATRYTAADYVTLVIFIVCYFYLLKVHLTFLQARSWFDVILIGWI